LSYVETLLRVENEWDSSAEDRLHI
jgi:hypothetical protein